MNMMKRRCPLCKSRETQILPDKSRFICLNQKCLTEFDHKGRILKWDHNDEKYVVV